MKCNIFFPVLLFPSIIFCQNSANPVSIHQEFATMATTHENSSSLQTFSTNQVDGSQFFLPDWQKGELALDNNEVFNKDIFFAYDKVRQELFMHLKDSTAILLGDKDRIKSFSLKTDTRQYNFITSARYSDARPLVFYQLLVDDSAKLTLLKYTSASFVHADKTDMMQMKEGNIYDAYVDKYTYYVVKGNVNPQPVALKLKSIKQVLSEMGINADKYIHEHSGAVNEDYLIGLVKTLNQ
jgi:hypothetical protein